MIKQEKLEITFKQFKDIAKYITVECPHCEDMFLLSEAKFKLKAEKIKSWLAKYNIRLEKLYEKEGKLEELADTLETEKTLMYEREARLREETKSKIATIKIEYLEKKKELSKLAIAKSKGVKLGYYLENWLPHFKPLLKYNPCDYVFLGKPIDFIIFDGLEADNVKKLIFLEAKTGNSQFTKREKQIRDCVLKGKVNFEMIRIKDKIAEVIKEEMPERKRKYPMDTYKLKTTTK
jgi:predicted Holliday junction resolvase-like endonuclease